MTAPRPGDDAGYGGSHEQGAYGDAGELEAAVDGLADPLSDPLPGQRQPPRERPGQGRHRGPRRDQQEPPGPPGIPGQQEQRGGPGQPEHRRPPDAPWLPGDGLGTAPVPAPQPPEPEWSGDYYRQYAEQDPQGEWSGGAPYYAQGPQGPQGPDRAAAVPDPATDPASAAPPPVPAADAPAPDVPAPVLDDRTVGLRTADTRRAAEPGAGRWSESQPGTGSGDGSGAGAGSEAARGREEPETPTGGRAERRKAAKGGSRARKRPEPPAAESEHGSVGGAPSRPLSRVEARRAARLRKESPAVIASRVVGELFITFGVVMLLFVTYQLWWTNIRAGMYAGQETNKIQDGFANGRKPGAFEPGQGFAIMHIPKLDVVVPIAEGISKSKVLDHGMVGHYAEGRLKTAMPDDKQGNFAVAGHRNTHGEPFRYINQLKPGDEIIVETREAYYTYDMASILPQTPPSNVSVIRPVPAGSGFTKEGRYITLTTCTPEFTSTYRMIVWGKMVEERPRSKGKPDALVG
ncbi:class E sortase [Streptomyces sp. NPDC088400]|uniref:class E sortase n=1 Tax=Streptomyces sp. NPDC088400 TaxID=3365861 RepID=UPI00381ACBCF